MGFKEAKARVLNCLFTGNVLHEERGSIDIKNLFATGHISVEEAAQIIGRSSGNSYSCTLHHFNKDIDVHLIKTRYSGQHWYIKWYFLGPGAVFISFHH